MMVRGMSWPASTTVATRAFLSCYVSRENAGGWNLIELYDVRGEESERLAFWERGELEG